MKTTFLPRPVLAVLFLALLALAPPLGAQVPQDWGDAPTNYFTLAVHNGARHNLAGGFRLGPAIDADSNGLPSANADGDDTTPAGTADDEDGITFSSPINPGQVATLVVNVAGNAGVLNAWLDFNDNGSWAQAGERVFTNRPVSLGNNSLSFNVPSTAVAGTTYARFRLTRTSFSGTFVGAAPDGEVEDYLVTISQSLDYGDAPDRPYPTRLASNGARHARVQGFNLGSIIDLETDGQPDGSATGDDTAPPRLPDDEDGVTLPAALVAGQTATVTIFLTSSAGIQARLDAWIDWNADGSWNEAGDQIFSSVVLTPGNNTLTFQVPANIENQTTFARFRLSRQGDLRPVGPAPDGEVEDYRVSLQRSNLDFGDAPQQYPTLLGNNGARHVMGQTLRLGTNIDAEADGLPSGAANGDDTTPAAGPDDEDGVIFTSALVAGQTATVTVLVTAIAAPASPRLFAWIDFNGNGSWADAGEQIFAGVAVNNGANNLSFSVPASAVPETTFARFRLSMQTVLFTGLAENGEVEDYQVRIQAAPLDFSDAPQQYPTLLANNGARHTIVQNFRLGTNIDAEPDGQPNVAATGDDASGVPDDEDGVVFTSALVAGQTATVRVTATLPLGGAGIPALLFAWVDFNANGSWADPGEQIFTAQMLSGGVNNLSFAVPSSATSGTTYARFRLTTQTSLPFNGPAINGEVEDYQVSIAAALDFGDAPEPYPTILSQNGARHVTARTFALGNTIDNEANGQPNASALGDDNNPPAPAPDDEDGVQLSALRPGESGAATVTLTAAAGGQGRLDAWIDFNRDGDWADAGEQIFISAPLNPGLNTLTFSVPLSAVEGPTFARFRLSRQGGLSFTGLSPDGEVEDYSPRITERPPQEECFGTCKGTDFWLTFPANYAPDPDNPLKLTLCIMGSPGTQVTVNFAATGFPLTVTIPASMARMVNLPVTADLGDAIDVIENKGVHVTASAPVSVHAESHALYTTDGYLGLPSPALGRAYVVQGFGNVFEGAADLNGSQFAIIACESNTVVGIRPSTAVAGHPANVIYNITLQQGQTYQLRATNDGPTDLSGTVIVADKPIGVFGSHRCANIPSSNVFFCDFIVEQLLPVTTWGVNFVTFPLATRSNGDTFRSQAAFNDTRVFFNGILVATLDQGESHQAQLAAGTHITADKPISVMQYANSADFDLQPFDQGDPFMVIVPSTPMFSTNHMVCTAPVDFTNYVNVIAPAAATASVRIDGAPVGVPFAPIAGSGYSGAQIPVTPGPHQISASQPIGVTVYGWAEYDSYGWPGCLSFGDLTPPTLTCSTSNATITVMPGTTAVCVGQVPDFRGSVQASDNCSPRDGIRIEQDPPPGTPVPGGTHIVRVIVTDQRGNSAACAITLRVLDPSNPVIFCPSNVVATCTRPGGAIVTYEVPARTQCGTPLPVQCNPPPGSLFPPGNTLVTCVATNDAGETASCEFNVTVRCFGFHPGPDGGLTLTWTIGGVLETADTIGGRWTRLPNAISPFRVTLDERQRFFRVRYE